MEKNILTMKDVDRAFTDTVKQYLDKGYTIRTSHMSGSQGEIAKVDLTNGAEVIRVLLDHMYASSGGNGLMLIAGRITDNLTRYTSIWNNHLEVLFRRRFFEISREHGRYTTSADFYDLIQAKRRFRRERWDGEYGYKEIPFPDQTRAKAIVLPFVRRHKGLARASVKSIDSVCTAFCGERKWYFVRVNKRILEFGET